MSPACHGAVEPVVEVDPVVEVEPVVEVLPVVDVDPVVEVVPVTEVVAVGLVDAVVDVVVTPVSPPRPGLLIDEKPTSAITDMTKTIPTSVFIDTLRHGKRIIASVLDSQNKTDQPIKKVR